MNSQTSRRYNVNYRQLPIEDGDQMLEFSHYGDNHDVIDVTSREAEVADGASGVPLSPITEDVKVTDESRVKRVFLTNNKSLESTDSGVGGRVILKSAILRQSTFSSSGRSKSPISIRRIPKSPLAQDFDSLFENPSSFRQVLRCESSIDEGVCSFDVESVRTGVSDEDPSPVFTSPGSTGNGKLPQRPKLTRGDSIMEMSLADMLIKNAHVSEGFIGFRRRTGNAVSHKYCNYCRVDDMVFIFLHVVFGMVYICAGSLGLVNCSGERVVNWFLIVDGILSVFIFPITIMEWTKRIGGCLNEDEKIGSPVYYIIISAMRIVAAISGSVIFATRLNELPDDNLMCLGVITLLKVGVVLEWVFVLFAVIGPYSLCLGAFYWGRSKGNT